MAASLWRSEEYSEKVLRVGERSEKLLRSEEHAEKVLRLGRRQLESLRTEGHPYGDARVRSLHRLLAEGGGLPLLFPEHDVGFTYHEGALLADDQKPRSATSSSARRLPAAPKGRGSASFSSPAVLRLGGRMPHFILRPWGDGTGERKEGRDGGHTPLLSTVDLPDQIRGLLLNRFSPKLSAAGSCGDAGGGGADGMDVTPPRGAAETSQVSLTTVLVVALPSDATACSSNDGDNAAITEAAVKMASVRWRASAISAQREFGAERATVETQEGSRTPCPLVVLTVHPSPRESTTQIFGTKTSRRGFPDEIEETMALVKGSAQGLARDGRARRARSSAEPEGPWRLGAIAHIEHLQSFLDGDDWIESMSAGLGSDTSLESMSAGKRPGAAVNPSVGARGNDGSPGFFYEGSRGWPGLVVSMRALDDSYGSLHEAFAAAGTEAVLIRPDGHIAWVARRNESCDETDEINRARGLGRALDAVFTGRRCV